jgi:hypothetical protein
MSLVNYCLEPISQIRNGCVVRDLALRQGARRQNILNGSLTDAIHDSSTIRLTRSISATAGGTDLSLVLSTF